MVIFFLWLSYVYYIAKLSYDPRVPYKKGEIMAIDSGVFGNNPSFDQRFMKDYNALRAWVEHLRALQPDIVIVLTSGTFDMYHVGHARYLARAKAEGDVLIVGVDDDEKTRARKGIYRPLIPEDERLEILAHDRSVDVVTLKSTTHERWEIIDVVRPNVLIATQETYTEQEVTELQQRFGCDVRVLEPTAESSTSNRIRMLNLNLADLMKDRFADRLPAFVEEVIDEALHGISQKPQS